MASIPSQQALPIFTEALAAKYDELQKIRVMNFGRSFFAEEIVKSRFIKTQIRRGTENVALDVLLGSQGIRTQASNFSTGDYDPFYYRYFSDATRLEIYWRLFPSASWNENDMVDGVNAIAELQRQNKLLIERAYELQCWQFFLTGKMYSYQNPASPVQIDFNRKSSSIVDLGSGEYWNTNASTCNPFQDVQTGCDWIRQNGLAFGFEFDVIMGESAYTAFINSSKFVSLATQLRNLDNDFDKSRRDEATGAVYHGNFSFGSYRGNVYTYNQFYQDPTTSTPSLLPYVDPKKVILLPKGLTAEDAQMIYTATPQLPKGMNTFDLYAADFVFTDYIDAKNKTHEFHVESAGLPVFKAVDKVYTMKVIS